MGGGGGAGSSGDDDFAPPASSLDPVGKRKRAAGEAGAPAAKVARSAATGATPQGGVQLDNKVRVKLGSQQQGERQHSCHTASAATKYRVCAADS